MKRRKTKIDPQYDLATLDFSTHTSYGNRNPELDPDDLVKALSEWTKSLSYELSRGSEANDQTIIDTALTRYKMILRDILSLNRTSLTRFSAKDLADMYYIEGLTTMIRQLSLVMTQICYLDLNLNDYILAGVPHIPLTIGKLSEAIDILEDEEYETDDCNEQIAHMTTMMTTQNTILNILS